MTKQPPKPSQPKQPNQPKQPGQPKLPKNKKSLGPALDWTDEDLDQMAEITPADLKAAEALWKNEAPPKFKQLLQAQVEEEGKK